MSYYSVIMAGGTGTRLWPMSRRRTPKQSLRLVGERTLFQSTIDRALPVFGVDRTLVVTGAEHVAGLARQAPELPETAFLVEPEGRGTAPCIALAAAHLQSLDADATMAVLTADQVISNVARFQGALRAAEQIAQDDYLVTLGIEPAYASTGYGYIEQGEHLQAVGEFSAFRVRRFEEKPDDATASLFVESGSYSWNSGMFVWRVDRILDEFRRSMPEVHDLVLRIASAGQIPPSDLALTREWSGLAKETIDYGIMEHARHIAVIPVDIGWSDVGSWSSLAGILPPDGEGNVVRGQHVGIETHNSLVLGGKRLIATIGLENLIIVDTEDALLVCSRDREQGVREIVRRLGRDGLADLL